MKKSILLPLFVIFFLQTGLAQPSLLDPSFGTNGIVKTDMGSAFNYNNVGKQVFAQPDGSMYLVFASQSITSGIDGAPYPTTITKILADGSRDLTYGHNGLSSAVPIYQSHAAIQSDGKIIIAGVTWDAGSLASGSQSTRSTDMAITRLNVDGTVDNTFNGGSPKTLSPNNNNYITALAVQSDGKIIIAAWDDDGQQAYLDLFRINPDGSIDNTFNESVTFTGLIPNGVAIQSDGKIVLSGTEFSGMASLRRFNSDGAVDPTFNGTGVHFIDFGVNGYSSAITVQSDDKIIIGGYTYNGTDGDFEVVRLNANGALDNTFDADARQTINFSGGEDILASVSLQGDGKIVLGGSTSNGGNTNFALARLNVNGSLDNTFSTDGKQITDFGSSADYANSTAIESDGKLIALGYAVEGANTHMAVARYNNDGSPDISFDGDGLLTPLIVQGDTHYTCTAIQADGKILAAGYTWDGTRYNFAIARYNTNGSLDNTFSGDGMQVTNLGSSDSKADAMVIQSDGKILVAGSVGDNAGVARYNVDGSLDNTFNGDGIVVTDFGSRYGVSMAVQGDGKILIAGAALARYNPNGSPDLTFNGSGEVTSFQDGAALNCYSVALQNDGKIVIAGYGVQVFRMARFNPNGSADITFNGNGEEIVFIAGNANTLGLHIAIQSDGKILVGGYSQDSYVVISSSFLLTRFNTDGSFDAGFNGGEILYTDAGIISYGNSILIQNDGKILLGGYIYNGSSTDFTILRYNSNGTLDPTFSGDGIEITEVSSAYNKISGMALYNESLYAVGFGQYPGNFGVVAKYALGAGGTLPVTLTDFTAGLKNKSVLLQWQTTSEHNLSGFIIERSADGNSFSPIGNVAAKGNSNIKINYSTPDQQPLQGNNFYRLKIMDADGKFTYSKIVVVNINDQLFTLNIFPNPASAILFVTASGENEKAIFRIVDVSGRKLHEEEVILNRNSSFTIDINTLPKGTYILQLNTKEKIRSRRFVKN